MTKNSFLLLLQKGLADLPRREVEERLNFYGEMIDDRMEEGLSEEEAVAAVGSVDEIVSQIMADSSSGKKDKKENRHLKLWEIILLVLGSPVWLSLVIAAAAVVVSVYIVLWSMVVSLWAVFGSLIVCALGVTIMGFGFVIENNIMAGIAIIGAGMVCTGMSVFAFYGCKMATKGVFWLTKKSFLWIKRCFVKKEDAQCENR